MSELRGIIDKYWEKVKEHRYWLHQHPEPSGQEKETSAYVAQVLRDMGLEPTEHVGGYGVTALIQGKGPGKCVGLRADMDALPLTEEENGTQTDFQQQVLWWAPESFQT